MKKNPLLLVVCLVAMFAARGQKITTDNFERLVVEFEVGELKTESTMLDGQVFTRLVIDGMMPSSQVGSPELPTWSSIIEVPLCAGFEVEVESGEWRVESGEWRVVPVQPSRSKSDRERHPMVMDSKVYSTDAFFSAAPLVTVERVGVARDRNLARLQFSPVRYNPVSGEVEVCRKARVTVRYVDADESRSMELFRRYHSPAFNAGNSIFNNLYPKSVNTTAPVRYLIVAHSMFRGELDEFVQWKRRKGLITDIVYTDDAGVGTTSSAIRSYIRNQYDNATTESPAPTYLLIVGDHEQIPAFTGTTDNDHITDLYYTTWTTGDNIPDCYCGRFSAQTVAQLTPQVEKTLMYEQYAFADPSFLDRAVMVAGVDGGSSGDYGYTHGDPAMDYAITNYVNGAHGYSQVMYFKNNTSIVPTGSNVTVGSSSSWNAATVRGYYNEGAGWINYTAHGSATSWSTPGFTTSDAAAMTNSQKFGIMIGNCCLTNRFQTTTCLGESVLRKGDYCGAVGYLGGSNSTYWDEDFYWAVGVRSSIGPSMSMAYNSSNMGGYDRIFHTHNEGRSAWVTTQGELMFEGNMSVQNSSSSLKLYYWEIYHLMGDPSLMPYLTQASEMTLTVSAGGSPTNQLAFGSSSMTVTAAPYAYVALTDTATRTLWASGFANDSGQVTLALPTGMPVGGYELAASAQQYRTAFRQVSVFPASGPYVTTVSMTTATPLEAGSTTPMSIKVANLGNGNASGVTLSLSSDNSLVTLANGMQAATTINLGSIASGDTVTVTTVTATTAPEATDGSHATVTATTNWTGNTTPVSTGSTLTVNAPMAEMQVNMAATNIMPDSTISVTVNIQNNGHATLGDTWLTITTGNPLLTVNYTGNNFTLAAGGTVSRHFELQAATTIDTNIFVPVYVSLAGAATMVDTIMLYIGINSTETFEGGMFQLQGWTQGSSPWTLTNEEAYEGTWSARSAAELAHYGTSEMQIDFSTTTADSISFYYKVSSETNYDKFHCYLDGTEMTTASGEVAWTRDAFPVSAGNHTLRFSYTKDVSMSSGSDCAWVDNISLPHGLHAVVVEEEVSDTADVAHVFQNLIVDFESAADDSRWTLVNGSLTNKWVIGNAASNGGSRGLYISNNSGTGNAYTINSSASVFAYTTVWLNAGDYATSFDWRCNGESNYDYMRAALVPASIALTASGSEPSEWSTTTVPTGAIAIDGDGRLNQSTTWQTKRAEVHITQSGLYRLVFYWRNDMSVGSMPPAAIDNVSLLNAADVHNVTVSASHGVTTGSGTYQAGETVTIGVFPEAGYTFVGWSDGSTVNPREMTVTADITLAATLTQSSIAIIHDTTYLNVPYPVHDTTVVTLTDTVTITEYLPYEVHDTMVITLIDTVNLTDTLLLTTTDTVWQMTTDTVWQTATDTVWQMATDTVWQMVTDTVWQTATDTVWQMGVDTVWQTVTDTVWQMGVDTLWLHDTTVVTLTDTVIIYDSAIAESYIFDTVTLTDTLWLTTTDTVWQMATDTVWQMATDTVWQMATDTVWQMATDTVWQMGVDTLWLHDTTLVSLTDTVTITEYVPFEVHDTTVVTLTDTVTLTEYLPYEVHDTTVVTLTDTVTLTEYVPYEVHDTTVITLTDTVTITEYVPYEVHDTTVVTLTDTVTLTEYVPYEVHDTTVVTMTDTVINTLFDTVYNTEYDTTVLTDTLWLVHTDTVWVFDTIVIHDTVYITQEGIGDVETLNVKVYSSNGQIIIEGAEGHDVTLYDVTGRKLSTTLPPDNSPCQRLDVPASGTYLIKIDNYPARKVVVIR